MPVHAGNVSFVVIHLCYHAMALLCRVLPHVGAVCTLVMLIDRINLTLAILTGTSTAAVLLRQRQLLWLQPMWEHL